ncbi:phosphoribosyltransferase [Merismopedia glauca]|uniref:Phosphoribosyltransferase n=1 Tax=Merismopedia glauca CCAP 1448/3 TaxID=1296344 RepID=A0A2T1C2Y8_9CYAN|nr:phosphoribosyltransferase family protein [Merismopedia glauca]PSB02507.1 phosphoribosyltransferase [Merismopedia glauca CCAP 1448/3]
MSHCPRFRDRTQAGEQLADAIAREIEKLDPAIATLPKIVYGLPRGGIPVALPIARQLSCPLEIIVAKKITLPGNTELAIGAVTADGELLWSSARLSQSLEVLEIAQQQALAAAKAQEAQLLPYCPQTSPQGAIAILVDDGIATGLTMAVAVKAIKSKNPAQVWISAPVAPAELIYWLTQWADKVIILATPNPFLSVSRFYQAFPQVETNLVINFLEQHNSGLGIRD